MDTQHLLEEVKKEISRLQQVVALLEGSSPRKGKGKKGQGKRKLSAAARKKIGRAQKERWAKYHAQKKKET